MILVTSTGVFACKQKVHTCVHVCLHLWAAVSNSQRRGDGWWLAALVSDVSPVPVHRGGWRQCLVCQSVWLTMSISLVNLCVSIIMSLLLGYIFSFDTGWNCKGSFSHVSSMGRDVGSLGTRLGSSRWARAGRSWVTEEGYVTLELTFRRSWAMPFHHTSADDIEEKLQKNSIY